MPRKSFEEWMAIAIRYGITTVLLFLLFTGFLAGVAVVSFMSL